jgi:preprotein translocase subunit SecD
MRKWLAGIPLRPGVRFGLEETVEWDADTRKGTPVGLRTFVLVGDPVLRTEDVVDAVASRQAGSPPSSYVMVTLSPEGSKRFEEATTEWTRRRMAILVDDVITSAPVIKTAIAGGHVSITMGASDPDRQAVDAERLASELRAR